MSDHTIELIINGTAVTVVADVRTTLLDLRVNACNSPVRRKAATTDCAAPARFRSMVRAS